MNNDVRQILMNELGLTRESVRREATEIIEPLLAAHIKKLLDDGIIETLVQKAVNRILAEEDKKRNPHYYPSPVSITDYIKNAASRYVEKWVSEHIELRQLGVNHEVS